MERNQGHCVDRVLRERGTRQRWLAGKLGISDAYLSRLLSGERRWSETLKDKVAHSLSVPRETLFFEGKCGQEPRKLGDETTDEGAAA